MTRDQARRRKWAAVIATQKRYRGVEWDGVFTDLIKLYIVRAEYDVYFPETWIDVHGRRIYTIQLCDQGSKHIAFMGMGTSVGDCLRQAIERFSL